MDKKDLIGQVLASKTLFELSDNLEKIYNGPLKLTTNKLYKDLYLQLKQVLFPLGGYQNSSYIIESGTVPVLYYLHSYWGFENTVRKNDIEMKLLVNSIRKEFSEVYNVTVPDSTIESLMIRINEEFPCFFPAMNGLPIKFLKLDNMNKEFAGQYTTSINTINGAIRDAIFVLPVKSAQDSIEFAILHEIGHLIHTRLTKEYHKLPESFEIILNECIPLSERSPSKNIEVFADFFAAAVMHDSEYEQPSKIKKIHDSYKSYFKEYFNLLFRHSYQQN